MADGYTETYKELIETTDWSKYGRGNDPRCDNCMAHCGYEPTAVLAATSSVRQSLRAIVRAALFQAQWQGETDGRVQREAVDRGALREDRRDRGPTAPPASRCSRCTTATAGRSRRVVQDLADLDPGRVRQPAGLPSVKTATTLPPTNWTPAPTGSARRRVEVEPGLGLAAGAAGEVAAPELPHRRLRVAEPDAREALVAHEHALLRQRRGRRGAGRPAERDSRAGVLGARGGGADAGEHDRGGRRSARECRRRRPRARKRRSAAIRTRGSEGRCGRRRRCRRSSSSATTASTGRNLPSESKVSTKPKRGIRLAPA